MPSDMDALVENYSRQLQIDVDFGSGSDARRWALPQEPKSLARPGLDSPGRDKSV